MRLGQLDAGEYTKIADVEGLRGTRLPAGRHVEMPELVSMFAACPRTTPIDARDAALLAVFRVPASAAPNSLRVASRTSTAWRGR